MNFKHFDVDSNLRENIVPGNPLFPVAVHLQKVNETAQGFVIPHWHDEFQFILQQVGSSIYKVNEKELTIHPGEGLFVNSRCLHSARALGDSSHYLCIEFHPTAIAGTINSPIDQEYVQPLITSEAMQVILLSPETDWQKNILELLEQLVADYSSDTFGHEFRVQASLYSAFAELVEHNQGSLIGRPTLSASVKDRMHRLTQYIEDHYTEDITLQDIASAVGISEGECCRCFKKMANLSPIAYLLQFRIAKSTALLTSTNLSVLDIALKCGFTSNSYFTMRFRKMMGCTPSEYRRQSIESRRRANS